MRARCPQCSQEFETLAGFCPFDGAALVSALDGLDPVSLRNAPSTTAALNAIGELEALDSAHRALIGQTLDQRYTIERVLGEGGAGVVFLARHALIDKPVAIKVIKREAASVAGVVQRFVQEARAATRIGHPNIVDITDFGHTPQGLAYSVMEYIEGPTLGQVIRADAPMPPARALPLAGAIAHALAAAHEKGIVHRDLKPENVFVTPLDNGRESVKIVDFGIAKVTALDGRRGPKLTIAGTVIGTPEYMAPEQAAGLPELDHRVDIYSLGVMLYQMLSGELPHDGGEAMRTLAMKMLDPPRPLGHARPGLDISPALERLVMHALACKPEARIPSMADFLDGLQTQAEAHGVALLPDGGPMKSGGDVRSMDAEPITRAADGLAESVPTLPRVEQAPAPAASFKDAPPPRRRPLAAALVIGLGLLASAAVGFAVMQRGQEHTHAAAVSHPGANAGSAAPGPERAGQANDARTSAPANAPLVAPASAPASDAGPASKQDGSDARMATGNARKRPPAIEPDSEPERTAVVVPKEQRRVKILTQPEHANLYVDQNYSGKGGTTMERAHGTEVVVECRLKGYHTGRVKVRFDGRNQVYLCPLVPLGPCVDGIKNPFQDCP